MRFYHVTRLVFPRSYALRIFAVCFAGVHFPLIGFGIFEAVTGNWDWAIFSVLLGATLAGTALAVFSLRGLLTPIEIATAHLRMIRDGKQVGEVPSGGADMAGDLLASVAHAARATAQQIDVLRGVAGTDPLTGLRNRRGFQDAVIPQLQAGRSGTIALIDGDRFKLVNDRHGHAAGDHMLQTIARRLGETTRETDVAARWGGDEFAIFFQGLGEEAASQVLERVHDTLMRRPTLTIDGTAVSFSYGLSEVGSGGRKALDDAFAAADRALYERKARRQAA